MNNITRFSSEYWSIIGDMAPYLLFGFLISGILSVVISPRIVEKNLGGKGLWPIIKASLFGIPLPLCSCGVIPVASSLYNHGANRSSTTSFLISTPQTGIDSIMVTYSLLGPLFTIFRPISAFLAGILGGGLVSLTEDSKEITPTHKKLQKKTVKNQNVFKKIFNYGFISLPQDIGKPLIVGLAIAALISMVVPDDFFAGYIGDGFMGMVIMMFAGIPVYVCATASVPVAVVLIAKGISPGAALVFLMTGPATNAATISTVWKIMGRRTAGIYLFTVAISSLIAGSLLNSLSSGNHIQVHDHVHWMLSPFLTQASSITLLLLLINAVYRLYFPKSVLAEVDARYSADMVLEVGGMTCNHCLNTVEAALLENSNVEEVSIDLVHGKVEISGQDLDSEELIDCIEAVGYSVTKNVVKKSRDKRPQPIP
jgi:hypothetical protein